ncbi:hypothetical protein QBC38DRAFT_198298 [Podospora fimiseda]|uniref:Chromo domain-containing protein n=1 Tax=Podospora fimiseda TaxID=252190 RepID=A0AAN7BPQ2_9PEZI|nr:hypothetical protein QBC38DRAFT_198298 [Podospora fimiseda]
MPIPEADMGLVFDDEEQVVQPGSASAKKRGRPSRSTSSTPAKSVGPAKTPRSGKSTVTPKSAKSTSAPMSARASTGRKRKSEEISAQEESEEAEPTSGRPSRTAGVAASARLATKAANKPKRDRPKSTDTTEKKPTGKPGRDRPKKTAVPNGGVPADEYEVEAIRDSRIDADTMEHFYEVKWKGYPESDNSWEPKTNLKHALDIVKAFDSKKKKQEIEEAKDKAKDSVAKASKAEPKAPPKPKAVKPAKPAKAAPAKKAAAAATATAGRRGRPARATRGSK